MFALIIFQIFKFSNFFLFSFLLLCVWGVCLFVCLFVWGVCLFVLRKASCNYPNIFALFHEPIPMLFVIHYQTLQIKYSTYGLHISLSSSTTSFVLNLNETFFLLIVPYLCCASYLCCAPYLCCASYLCVCLF